MNALRAAVAVLLAGMLALTACASVPPGPGANTYVLDSSGGISSSVPDDAFYTWLKALGDKAKADPAYKRIPFGNAAQSDAFIGWVHAMYRQLITPAQFKAHTLDLYPRNEYELDFVISSLPPVSER